MSWLREIHNILKMPHILGVFLFQGFVMTLTFGAGPQTIKKKVQEEASSGSILVDLRKEAQFSDKSNKENVKFKILTGTDNHSRLLDFDEKGLLRSVGRLDREALCPQAVECVLNFKITTSPNFELIKVDVEIEDINDNAPQFHKSHMKTNISESTNPGKFFYVYLAKDLDSPAYGIVNYTLDQNQDPKNLERFSLKQERSQDGQIRDVILMTNEPLDREEQSSYLLKILAIDGGNPPKTGSATIEVSVLDLNEHSPEFIQTSFHVNVTENAPPRRNLLQTRATDKDVGVNGDVRYSFSNKTLDSYRQYFKIDQHSGMISQLKSLDFEKTPSIQLEVQAQDQGAEPLTSKTMATINVENINDNLPRIRFEDTSDEIYGTTISEDAPNGTFIVQFSVIDDDGDAMSFIQCHLTLNQSKNHPYRMTRIRGMNEFTIETNSQLDRESSDRHLLLINCQDGGQPPLTSVASYHVNITDVNDNAPKFSSTTYNITVHENNTPFEKNFYVRATDTDQGLNGKVTYSLQSGSDGVFQIDENSGALWTTVALDREKNSFYILKVVAKDSASEPLRKSSTATITISVADANDEPPRFKQPSYNFSIIENKHGKSEIGRVLAVDLDLDSKSVYFFDQNSGVNHRLFKIDSKSGIINVTRPLNREERDLYTWQVIVRDEQAPHLQDTAEINVHVLDENDNPPIVEFPVPGNNTVYISRNAPLDQAIAKIVAKDADLGNNSTLSYSISQVSHENLVKIDPNTGEVFLNSSLPPDASAFNAVVMVKDLGTPPKMTIVTLEVYVDSLAILQPEARPFIVQRILTEAHLAVVVGVAAGCFLIIIFLICVVCSVSQRKSVKRPNKSPGVPKNKVAVETYESDIKFNPCHVEGGNSERGSQYMSSENRSQIRGSFIASDDLDNTDALILANLNSDIPVPSPMTLDRRSSRLHSATSDVGINVGSGNYYQCDSPGLPTDPLYSNKSSAFKNVKYVDCCRLNSEIESGIYQSTRPIYTSPEYNDPNSIPPSSSPEWLMQAVQQRKQSFSRWLNCENPIKSQMYNIHEYSTIPSLNRLASNRFSEDSSTVTKSVIGNDPGNGDALGSLSETHPLLMRTNFPVRSSPTYVGLYSRPFAPRPFLHGSSLENENVTLKSFHDKSTLSHRSIVEEVPQML